mmetsp:Transcript_46763/g.111217  ORF Transcript_46763/g.111217 Transcript_46763/m.111217 type:complete len:220 (-) Transcript_46763:287-946(-)
MFSSLRCFTCSTLGQALAYELLIRRLGAIPRAVTVLLAVDALKLVLASLSLALALLLARLWTIPGTVAQAATVVALHVLKVATRVLSSRSPLLLAIEVEGLSIPVPATTTILPLAEDTFAVFSSASSVAAGLTFSFASSSSSFTPATSSSCSSSAALILQALAPLRRLLLRSCQLLLCILIHAHLLGRGCGFGRQHAHQTVNHVLHPCLATSAFPHQHL